MKESRADDGPHRDPKVHVPNALSVEPDARRFATHHPHAHQETDGEHRKVRRKGKRPEEGHVYAKVDEDRPHDACLVGVTRPRDARA